MLEVVLYVLMVAPSPTDHDVELYSLPIAVYEKQEDCVDAMMWIDEHQMELPRHIFCMPIGLAGEPT